MVLRYQVNQSTFVLNYEAISALLTEACFLVATLKKINLVGLEHRKDDRIASLIVQIAVLCYLNQLGEFFFSPNSTVSTCVPLVNSLHKKFGI